MSRVLQTTAPALLLSSFFRSRSFERISYEEYRKTGGNSFVKLQDGWTNYELAGDASSEHTVVLIHGGTIPLCIWEPQMEALRSSGFRILRYDQYGRGFSDRPATVYSRDLFLRQLTGLLDALRINAPVTLVGPSFGGAISINFAANYPDRTRSIVLVSPALNLIGSESSLAGSIQLLRTPFIGTLLYKLFLRNKIIARGRVLAPGGKGKPCDTTFVGQFRCRGTEHALLSFFRNDAMGNYRELTQKAGKLIPHILLVRGATDTEITAKMIEEVKADLPQCIFVEIENSGHGAATDAPGVFNKLLIDYIKSH